MATRSSGKEGIMTLEDSAQEGNVVKLPPEPHLRDELKTLVEKVQNGCQDTVIDFTDVDIITSASLSRLLQLQDLLKDSNCQLLFCDVSEATRGVFAVVGLAKAFTFCGHPADALRRLERRTCRSCDPI